MNANPITELSEIVSVTPPLLGESDMKFANSLIKQFSQKSSLSGNQWPWVEKLVAKATHPDLFAADKSTESIGDFSGVINLFLVAKEHLKYPKVTLATQDGDPIQLSMAGPNAKFPGTINVTDGGSWGNSIFYGRVDTQGEFQKYSGNTDEVIVKLKELAINPHMAAHFHGKNNHNCCFCQKDLTQANSVAAGYGPVCAGHWGLTEEWKAAVENANHVH